MGQKMSFTPLQPSGKWHAPGALARRQTSVRQVQTSGMPIMRGGILQPTVQSNAGRLRAANGGVQARKVTAGTVDKGPGTTDNSALWVAFQITVATFLIAMIIRG